MSTVTPTATTGSNIRAEMARRGINQSQLAAALGISQSGVSKRLRGDTPFDVNELATVAGFLGVAVESLLEGVAA